MLRLAVITDLHQTSTRHRPDQQGDRAIYFLTHIVAALNESIAPDIVLVAGDIINDPAASDAIERCHVLNGILSHLDAPRIVIPGNHDLAPADFYKIFPRPAVFTDIGHLRILSLVDPEEPGSNARRTADGLDLMRLARDDHSGSIAVLQHMSLHPPHTEFSPFNLTNAEDVIDTMTEARIGLSISGHHHAGFHCTQEGISFISCRALCEEPHPVTLIEWDGESPPVNREWSLTKLMRENV